MTKPHRLGAKPHSLGTKPHRLGTKPHSLGAKPHSLGAKLHSLGAKPHSLGTKPHRLSTKPHSLGAKPHSLGAKPHSLGIKTLVLWLNLSLGSKSQSWDYNLCLSLGQILVHILLLSTTLEKLAWSSDEKSSIWLLRQCEFFNSLPCPVWPSPKIKLGTFPTSWVPILLQPPSYV